MRVGENPTKYARKSKGKASIPVKLPLPITVCTVTYVPNLENYYKEGLDVLKLNFHALRKNTKEQFDFAVFDNGSCKEVVEWLVKLKEENIVQWLYLSSENMKKLGAWNILFSAAQGDYVYYFDSDIYHYKNWLEGMRDTLTSFPNAGIVGGFHNIPTSNIDNSIKSLSDESYYKLKTGHFIETDTLKDLAISLGTDVEHFVKKKKEKPIHKITYKSISAYVGCSHCQFLSKRECLIDIFPRPRDWGIKYTDKEFDRLLDENGWLRLTTIDQYVYHIGNRVEGIWREMLEKTDYSSQRVLNTRERKLSPAILLILSLPPVKKFVRVMYNFFFNLLYKVR